MVSRSKQLELMTRLARAVRDSIAAHTPEGPFGRLAQSFRFLVTSKSARIYSTYYWTRFVNDGRKAINLTDGRVMMYFKDPTKDPRIQDDYPRTRSGRRKLTKLELREAKKLDEIIVTRSVGPVAPTKFIEQGVRDARQNVPRELRALVIGETRKLLRRRRDKIVVAL